MQGFRMVDGGSSYWNGEGRRRGRKREREEIERQRASKWALACQGPWLELKFGWRNIGRDWGTVQRVRWVEGINTPSSHYFCLLFFSWCPSTRDQEARKFIDGRPYSEVSLLGAENGVEESGESIWRAKDDVQPSPFLLPLSIHSCPLLR